MKILPALLILVNTAWSAENLEQTYTNHGRLIVTQFVSAPFPHPTRAEGHKYKDKFFPAKEHYSDSTVAMFIPDGFRESGRIDFVIHFHGWQNNVAGTLSGYKLVEQFVASGRNAVLIVPEGPRDASDSFGGKLEDPDGFKKFIAEAIATLKTRGGLRKKDFSAGNIILSGHSGGYHVMSAIVDCGGMSANVKEVWLFDALYGEADKFLKWQDKGHGRLLNIYTDGGGTKANSLAMMAALENRGLKFLATEESKAAEKELKTGRLIFLHTDLGHNDVVSKRREFELFLRTSCLGKSTK